MPSFDVTSTDAQRFRQFINELRKELRVTDRPFVMQEAARLPPQVDNPGHMELVLRGNNRQVTLIVRTDNLYVIGFRNDTGQAYEFLHDNGRPPMIQGSIPLPFNGSYTGGIAPLDMVRAFFFACPEVASQHNRLQILLFLVQADPILGPLAVQTAIRVLSAYDGRDSDEARRGLRVLIVNFIESIRINDIADRVGSLMRSPSTDRDRRLTTRNINLINNWGSLSSALRMAANNIEEPGASFFSRFSASGIGNAYQAAVALGMVLIATEHSRRSVSSTSGNGDIGLMLVEVIGVLINDIDREDPGDLYGTVSITDCFGTKNMFDRDKYNTQSVRPGGWADITWPFRALSAADNFTINVHLMDHDSFPDLSPDDEVARGRLFWNSRDALSRECNAVRKKQFKGEYGSVDVLYAVLTDSVSANVRVIMVDGDNEAVPDVYGTITAATRMASGESLHYSLFGRERGQSISVRTNAAILLKRRVMSVALCSELRVDADLWDADRFPDLSPDDHIALGHATFRPRVQGNNFAVIKGKYGSVRVEVTWSATFAAS
jgi:hypothetical protein